MNKFIKEQQELARNITAICDPSGYAGLSDKELDTLISQVITNTGAEIMRRVEGEREQDECLGQQRKDCPWCSRDMYCRDRKEAIGTNEALDTIKQHIEDVIE